VAGFKSESRPASNRNTRPDCVGIRKQIVQRLDARLASAQKAGDLSFINREFKRRRQEAFAQGRPFLPYRTVQARLRQALSESRPAGRRRGSSSGCLNHRAILLVNKFLGRRWDDESC